jgi:F420-dependent oxidoreductase-like protein
MELGIHYANFTLPGGAERAAPTLLDTARAAEEIGCTNFTLMDHFFQLEGLGGALEPMLEGYSALGFLAGQTERMTLGLLVTGVTDRHPGLLAKTVTTLDVVSGGRAELGIGAAWYEREHLGLGVPYPPTAERFERMEEAIQICLQMWRGDESGFQGTHYQLAETICSPRPVSEPRPRILIGGSGERKTLRLVAQYADACNLIVGTRDELAHKIDVLSRHCDDLGRDLNDIEITTMYRDIAPDATVDDVVRGAEELAALGVSALVTGAMGPDPGGWLESTFGPAMDRIVAIEPKRF